MSKAKSDLKRDSQTVTVRVNGHLKEAYEQALDDKGSNMSEDLRAHMEAVADTGESEGPLPDDEELQKAYQTLDRLADPRTRKVDNKIAQSKLANVSNTPKDAVRNRLLRPLERQGYIEPVWGQIRVFEVEQ